MLNSAATTSITGARRITAASCSFIGVSAVYGGGGWVVGRVGGRLRGRGIAPSYGSIRYCCLGSHTLGPVRGVTPEEPAAGNLHGGVCEGGVSRRVMVDLNGHEAGNGGHSQRTPTADRDSSTRKIFSTEGGSLYRKTALFCEPRLSVLQSRCHISPGSGLA